MSYEGTHEEVLHCPRCHKEISKWTLHFCPALTPPHIPNPLGGGNSD